MATVKKGFVFDTNFIVQNQNLDEALEKIKDTYSIYISQVSIDERIAQNCRELKADFDAVSRLSAKYTRFAKIELIKTYDEEANFYKSGIQAKYEQYFGDNILPFVKDGKTLEAVIDRANQKLPPFSNAKDASDKGFKDCLLWFSILDYFKNNGEDIIIFSTDDNGFRSNADYLCAEFRSITGKTIEIKPNNSFKDLVTQQEAVVEPAKKEPLPDFSTLRDEIAQTIDAIRYNVYYDSFGNEQWDRTFYTHTKVDTWYMEVVFSGLRDVVKSFIFNQSIPASRMLGLDDRIIDESEISMTLIEKCLKLFEEIAEKYPDYKQQFYAATADIINKNYIEPSTNTEDDDLPF